MFSSQRGLHRASWCLVLLCLLFTVAVSQTSSEVGSLVTDPETTAPETSTPDTEDPETTAPDTEDPETTAPDTIAPETLTPDTTAPETLTPDTTDPETLTPDTTAPPTTPDSPTTSTPLTATPTSPGATSPAPTSKSPTTTTRTTSPVTAPSTPTATSTPSPATTTAAPTVKHYNSSTLPPNVNSSVLNGTDLVTVEVTETALGNGTTTTDYSIISKSGTTVKTTTLTPTISSTPSSGSATTSKSGSSLGIGAIVGIIAGSFVFMLVLFAFFIAQRRRNKTQLSEALLSDVVESPVVGKKVRLLEPGSEQGEVTGTTATANSQSFAGSMQYRSTMWEDPLILASRIPIDRIELGAVIGRGAFGEVYRGRYRDQDVAIKTLVPEKRKDMAHIEAFLAEVRLMATMEHPHIVPFIGVAWESLSDLYCVTEFMAGGDLRTLLKDYLAQGVPQGMDASKMQIAYGVAYALTYLHSLEPLVLHRDLKSRNILLTESLSAMITDFGASRLRSDATMTSNVGSSLWMAPEVMMGQRYDEKADIFSFGVVISELDTHELPYSHAKEENTISGRPIPDTAVLQMVAMGKLRVHFSSAMHPDMVRFVETCVSVDPNERPTAAQVLYHLQVALRDGQF